MISKINYLFAIGFLVFSLSLLGCEKGAEVEQPVIHVSQRVKIKRPEAVATARADEAIQPEVIAPATEAVPPPDVALKQEPVLDPVPLETALAVAPEINPEIIPATPVTTAGIPEMEDAADLLGEKEALFGDQELYYVKKGRVDPFKPFLHKPEPKVLDTLSQEPQRRTPRTPLERIAIGQLKLTAVMRLTSQNQSMALVEDNNGKGYIVKSGTYIGEEGGLVSEIQESKLIIEESYKDVFGKASVRKIELKLQKPAGE